VLAWGDAILRLSGLHSMQCRNGRAACPLSRGQRGIQDYRGRRAMIDSGVTTVAEASYKIMMSIRRVRELSFDVGAHGASAPGKTMR